MSKMVLASPSIREVNEVKHIYWTTDFERIAKGAQLAKQKALPFKVWVQSLVEHREVKFKVGSDYRSNWHEGRRIVEKWTDPGLCEVSDVCGTSITAGEKQNRCLRAFQVYGQVYNRGKPYELTPRDCLLIQEKSMRMGHIRVGYPCGEKSLKLPMGPNDFIVDMAHHATVSLV